LHGSEINGRVQWFYDGDWRVVLGDELNGWKAGENVSSAQEAAEWLIDSAVLLYPESLFAENYRHLVSEKFHERKATAESGRIPERPEEAHTDQVDKDEAADFIDILLRQ